MNLTEHQTKTANNILTQIYGAMRGVSTPFIGLKGAAGVGKTFTVQMIIKALSFSRYSIRATAPTHKATRVLTNNLKNLQYVDISTIHNFLKLKLKPNFNTGLQELIDEWSGNNSTKKPMERCDLLIVDECSMVSTELLQHIHNAWKKGRFKAVLFIGDHIQLKPVDSNSTGIFNMIQFHELKEVMRQALDNPIINKATQIREMIESQKYIPLKDLFCENDNSENITILTDGVSFVNKYLSDDSDKIVCSFTNSTIDTYNRAIRKRIKGDIPYIVKDDILVFQESFTKGDRIIHMNNDEVSVYSAFKKFDKALDIEYWDILPVGKDSFKIVDIDSIGKYNDFLENLKKNASECDPKERSRNWAIYFDYKGRYADVKYSYACTIHKLQGSTYENVYFDMRSLMRFGDMDTVYRLIYVALTRASEKIFIFV